MTHSPHLVDRPTLQRRRARAARIGGDLFLHNAARTDIEDRLSMVNRTFTNAVVISDRPEVWQGLVPGLTHVPEADTLPLEPEAHDLVIHGMALHWSDDPVGQLIQCRRALKPDGLFLAALPGGQTLTELRRVLSEAEIAICGGLSPRILPMAEIRDLGALLQRAGFALPVADTTTQDVRYRDIWHLMADLRAMGETNAMTDRLRKPTPRGLFELADALYRTHFGHPEGGIRASFETIYLTGWAPSATQPQPLRPGSASARLADALSTTETPLPD